MDSISYDNVALEEPSRAKVLTYAVPDYRRTGCLSCGCSRTELVDVRHKLKRSVVVYFRHATPEFDYACYLEEGSDVLWEIDFIKEGRLERVCGKVKSFEIFVHRHLSPFTYSKKRITPEDENVVVRFDCSTDFDSVVIPIEIRNIRKMRYSDANYYMYNSDGFILVPPSAYGFIKNKFPMNYDYFESLPTGVDTSKTFVGSYLFAGCYKLKTIPNDLDFSIMISSDSMFLDCESLEDVEILNAKKLKNAREMFSGCTSIKSIDLSDTVELEDCVGMFFNCTSLESLKLNAQSVTNFENAFYRCTSLKDLDFGDSCNIRASIDLSFCPLTPDSIKNVLSCLSADIDGERVLVLPDNSIVPEGMEEQIKMLYAYGWRFKGLLTEGLFITRNEPPIDTIVPEDARSKEEDPVVKPEEKKEETEKHSEEEPGSTSSVSTVEETHGVGGESEEKITPPGAEKDLPRREEDSSHQPPLAESSNDGAGLPHKEEPKEKEQPELHPDD